MGAPQHGGTEMTAAPQRNESQRQTARGSRVDRRTVALSAYPGLVVVYLGMRVNALTGIKTMLGLGPQINKSVEARPDGLLLHETVLFSLRQLGMRQYWRDFESLEA